MKSKKIHYLSGIVLMVFITMHLINHLYANFGADKHIVLMSKLRKVYRNPVVETLLLGAILIQITSGIKLCRNNRKFAVSFFDKLQIWTGLYLAFFFVIHVSAVVIGRYFQFDTNFYFSASALNTFPFYLFFFPYYTFAIMAFFGHLASVHFNKMKRSFLGMTLKSQAIVILIIGAFVTFFIFFGATNRYKGIEIPGEYRKPD